VFGDPALRALLLFGWLTGFYILPEGVVVAQSGLCAATGLAMSWTQLRGKVIAGQPS
jgi:hypothetical protein